MNCISEYLVERVDGYYAYGAIAYEGETKWIDIVMEFQVKESYTELFTVELLTMYEVDTDKNIIGLVDDRLRPEIEADIKGLGDEYTWQYDLKLNKGELKCTQ